MTGTFVNTKRDLNFNGERQFRFLEKLRNSKYLELEVILVYICNSNPSGVGKKGECLPGEGNNRVNPSKMKESFVEISVYLSCVSVIFNFYASFITFLGFLAHFLIFIIFSCGFFWILWRYRIPKPEDSAFRNIFGVDWGAYGGVKNDKKSDGEYAMRVIGHRACGLDAPENSMSALNNIKKEGISAVEFDVMLTADEVPIVFHDENLCRMTNLNKNVSSVMFDEIQKLDISVTHPFGRNFTSEKIPTLNDYVTFCMENNIRMFLDLKGKKNTMVKIICDLYKQYPKMYDLGVVSSFNPILIYNIRTKDPKITCSLAWRPYFYSHEEYNVADGPSHPRSKNLCSLSLLRLLNRVHEWALWEFGYYVLGISALLLHKDMITREMVYHWNRRGVRVIAWSVNLPTEKQYFEKILEIAYLTDTVINS